MRQMFNQSMFLAALAGIFFWFAFQEVQTARLHEGPGIVSRGNDDDVWAKKVSEADYKWEHYTRAGLFAVVGIFAWVFGATVLSDSKPARQKDDHIGSN